MNKEIENRNKFIEYINSDLQNANYCKIFYLLEKAVKTKNKKLISYENIISIGAKKTGEKIDKKEYEKLLEKVYAYWWKNAFKPTYDVESKKYNYENSLIKLYAEDNEYNPDSNERINIFEILEQIQDRNMLGIRPPTFFQDKYFCHFYVNDFSLERMKYNKIVQTRLYLNIKTKNIISLANKLIDSALKNNTPLLFKFALKEGRNDNFVLYTNYEDIYSLIDLIEKTKLENPKLFVGCKVKNPLMGVIKDYIGYGDEPFTWGSFNSVRVDALEKCYDILTKKYKDNTASITEKEIMDVFNKVCEFYQIDKNNFFLNAEEKNFNSLDEFSK